MRGASAGTSCNGLPENQFEFVTRKWINNPKFSTQAATGHACGAELPIGFDPVIGQNNMVDGDRTRTFFIQFEDDHGAPQCAKLTAAEDWVIPTGGGYFFTPSITVLELLSY